MRWIFFIVVDLMDYSFAAADVVWDIFYISSSTYSGREVQAGNIQANSVSLLKKISGRKYLDSIFLDFARYYGFTGFSC